MADLLEIAGSYLSTRLENRESIFWQGISSFDPPLTIDKVSIDLQSHLIVFHEFVVIFFPSV